MVGPKSGAALTGLQGIAAPFATVLMFWLGPKLGLTPPDVAEASEAMRILIFNAATGALTALGVYQLSRDQ